MNLLSHVHAFAEFIRVNQNRDTFMEGGARPPSSVPLALSGLQLRLGVSRAQMGNGVLSELYEMDHKEWKDDYVWFHEKTLDYALQKLELIFRDWSARPSSS